MQEVIDLANVAYQAYRETVDSQLQTGYKMQEDFYKMREYAQDGWHAFATEIKANGNEYKAWSAYLLVSAEGFKQDRK